MKKSASIVTAAPISIGSALGNDANNDDDPKRITRLPGARSQTALTRDVSAWNSMKVEKFLLWLGCQGRENNLSIAPIPNPDREGGRAISPCLVRRHGHRESSNAILRDGHALSALARANERCSQVGCLAKLDQLQFYPQSGESDPQILRRPCARMIPMLISYRYIITPGSMCQATIFLRIDDSF